MCWRLNHAGEGKIFCDLKKYLDEDGESGEEEGDWLVRHLAALPCFPLVYRNLAASLRRACQVETDPATVALYIRSVGDCFLYKNIFL